MDQDGRWGAQVKMRGLARLDALLVLASAAFNIKRIVALRAQLA